MIYSIIGNWCLFACPLNQVTFKHLYFFRHQKWHNCMSLPLNPPHRQKNEHCHEKNRHNNIECLQLMWILLTEAVLSTRVRAIIATFYMVFIASGPPGHKKIEYPDRSGGGSEHTMQSNNMLSYNHELIIWFTLIIKFAHLFICISPTQELCGIVSATTIQELSSAHCTHNLHNWPRKIFQPKRSQFLACRI